MLPIVLSADIVESLFNEVELVIGYQLMIDLAAQTVTTPSGKAYSFEVDNVRKHNLLNGLDDIG